ncbi:MAG: hypothetical protein HQ581_18055, partial [Planctomycetes bacterium]|nr:hypothetical protein [Planctomycetota bacterium]
MMAKLTAVGIALAVLACAHSGEAQYYQFGQLAYSQPYQTQQAGYPSAAGYPGGQSQPYIMQASWPQTVPRAGLDYDAGSQGRQSAALPQKCRRPDRALFGEFLYMRPRNAEVAFAVPINGAIAPPAGAQPIQVGETAVVDIDYSPGFRVGFRRSMDEWASVGIAYTHFESSSTYETTESRPNIVLRSLVTHPGAQAAPTDYLSASGRFDFDMDLADVDYRCVIAHGDRFVVDCLLGLRYAHLEQTFSSTFGGNGVEVVNSNVLFDGGGLRVGIIGERHACNSGFLVFGRGFVSLLAGEFRGTYLMGTGVD